MKRNNFFFTLLKATGCMMAFASSIAQAAVIPGPQQIEAIRGCRGHFEACQQSFESMKITYSKVKEVRFRQDPEHSDVTLIFIRMSDNRIETTDMATKDFEL